MKSFRQITPPASLPITLSEAKAQSRVLNDVEDSAVVGYLRAGLAYAEKFCGRAFEASDWEASLDCFPTGDIVLWPLPLSTVIGVNYLDGDGALQTIPEAEYAFSADGRLSGTWPTAQAVNGAVRIRYTVGGFTPPDVRHAILLMAAHWYNSREAAGPAQSPIPFGAETLLQLHRDNPA